MCIAVIGLVHKAAAEDIGTVRPRGSDAYEVTGSTHRAGCDLGPLAGSAHIFGSDRGVVVCSHQYPRVHSAHGRKKETAEPVVARYRGKFKRRYFRTDAAFARYPTSAPAPSYPVSEIASSPVYVPSRLAADVALPISKGPMAPTPPAWMNWTGFYVGAHVGAAVGTANFADPFGSSIFGDQVTTPGFLAGGQIGFNWQVPNSNWVLGVEADISGFDSDGTNTCFAASALTINATCRVRPEVAGTLTGRIGYAVGPSGHTLIYGKGGVAGAYNKIDMAQNFGGIATLTNFNSQSATLWGGTFGGGVEQALTPAWSLKLEYDYLVLGNKNVSNVGSATCPPFAGGCGPVVFVPPGTSSFTQNIQEVKIGLNYKWGADPRVGGWDAVSPMAYPAEPPPLTVAGGWELEGGGRYFGSWGQFKKDIGFSTTAGLPSTSSISRLTYDNMQTNSGEFFGRVETPWNLFVKGFIGGGGTNNGDMNDEDFLIPLGGTVAAYSNTLSPAVTGSIGYGAIDGGFDFLRGPGYKVGVFGGYFVLNQEMKAFGCTPIANINCIPAVPTSGSPVITENDNWQAARIGLAGETMLTDRVKISGEVAYLPWAQFNGVDQHFFGNSGILASDNPESGRGQGVQLEALASYYITPEWSVGLGGRYWGMWTTNGQIVRDYSAGVIPPAPTTPPQFFKAQVEQAGVFVQASYKFGPEWFCFVSQSCM